MTGEAVLVGEEARAFSADRLHLSHSRIQKYLDCPEKYRLYYVEGLRPRYSPASLVFGRIIHEALSSLFRSGEDPAARFLSLWHEVRQVELTYRNRESWERLRDSGEALLAKFVAEALPRITAVEASEKAFSLDITTLDLPFVGVIDLVATVGGKRTVVDFKTAASGFEEHEAALSDQLSAYQLAEPSAEQSALCVLVKTKEPKIEWHLTRRTAEDLTDYLAKAAHIAHEIATSHFYRRPGKWCSWCEFLPVCLRDQKKVQETLVHVP